MQFEEYLLALISSVKCHTYLTHHAHNPRAALPQVEGDPANDFGVEWIDAWTRSENYRIWDRYTDSHLFDIVEPKHPCAGGLTIDDVQRRIAEQVSELHLDERFAVGKEVLGRNLAAGKEKASTVFNKLYADMEALRESQKRKQEEKDRNGAPDPGLANSGVQSVGSKAGAYLGSWGAWVGEKRKGFTAKQAPPWVKKNEKENVSLPVNASVVTPAVKEKERPKSYNESLFDAEATEDSPRGSENSHAPEQHTSHIPALKSVQAESPSDEFVSVPVSEEAQAWEEGAKLKVDLEARSHAVAAAVHAATTPISPS